MPGQLTLATQADGGFETHRKPTQGGSAGDPMIHNR